MTNQLREELETAEMLRRLGVETHAEQAKDISDPKDNITMYHTETGEPRTFPKYMAVKTAAKRLRNGQRAFTDEPVVEFVQGNVKCLLHPDHPRRKELNEIGLSGRTCPAAHLASEYDMSEHMRRKHRRESAVIEQHEMKKRDEEYRAAQAATLELLKKGAK